MKIYEIMVSMLTKGNCLTQNYVIVLKQCICEMKAKCDYTLEIADEYSFFQFFNSPSPIPGPTGPLLVLPLQPVLIPVVAQWVKPLRSEAYLPHTHTHTHINIYDMFERQ